MELGGTTSISRFKRHHPDLISEIMKLAESDPSLLVNNLAKEILKDLSELGEEREKIKRKKKNEMNEMKAVEEKSSHFKNKSVTGHPSNSTYKLGLAAGTTKTELRRTWSDLSPASSASPGLKIRSRPLSPLLLHNNTLLSSTLTSTTQPLTPKSNSNTSTGLPTHQRRISIRAKSSPPAYQA